jgi:hypothetical protein
MVVERRGTFDDPPWSKYELLVNRNGRFYAIQYGLNQERTKLPAIMREYLETLAFEAPP